MKNVVAKLLVIIMCIFSVMSCNKKEEAASAAVEQIVNTAPSASTDNDTKVIASVNGKNINQGEVAKELQNILMQYQGSVPPQQLMMMQSQLRGQAVESLINKLVLFAEAEKNKIQIDGGEIDAEMKKIASQFETPEKLKEQLAQMGMSEEKLREDIKQNFRIEKLLKSKLPVITVTDEEIDLFYKENPENFTTPEKITASHILLSLKDNATDEIKKQKSQELETVLEQIKGGADFAELAGKNSECPSKEQGGNLGSFSRGSMVKPFEDVAFNLKKDEVSGIVETQFGLHLIKLIDRTEAQTASLEQVKDKISTYLESQKKNTEVAAYLSTLRSTAKIDYKEGAKKN